MLSRIPYGTFANYSPRGTSELSKKSRDLCGAVKGGRAATIESALLHLTSPVAQALAPFLNPDVTLVPVPRSAPLAEGALWPAKVIVDTLYEGGLAGDVLPCIKRTKAVRKSSTSPANERPLVPEHYESLGIDEQLMQPAQITLVDDVLTMGRTMFACALRVHEAYPKADIRAFAMIRTQGLIPDIETIVDPEVGTISYYERSGKTFRDP